MRRWMLLAAVFVAALGGAAYFRLGREAAQPRYLLAEVSRGEMVNSVSSTGKVNPVRTVEVGSQVSGQIAEVLADFNTPVTAGQVVAKIDPASFQSRVEAAQADLAVAEAGIAIQEASAVELKAEIEGAEAALRDAEQELQRTMALFDKRVASQSAVDKALSARDQAQARLDGLKARVKTQAAQMADARAQVKVKRATLRDRQLDLDRTVIRSPVDGVVVGRNVNLGQTVAASLQAPVLFTIAEDLSHMQVEVSVDEADIGRVREGQRVTFTVDAYPRREFAGQVRQVRKAPTEVANVVTYTVIVDAANPDQTLLPGMTANVEIVVGERRNVLRVAEAALRFRPDNAPPLPAPGGDPAAARAGAQARIERLSERLGLSDEQRQAVTQIFRETGASIRDLRQGGLPAEQMDEAVRQLRAQAGKRIAGLLNPEQAKTFRQMQAEAADVRRAQVWTLAANGTPVAVDIVAGLSDGTNTEILRGDLAEGAKVIVGVAPTPR